MTSSASHTLHFDWKEFWNSECLHSGPQDTTPHYSQEWDVREELIRALTEKVTEQAAEILELRSRLGLNSTNSSKPPSSDGYAKPKPKSRRQPSGKKPGGQPGHKGSHMEIPHEPDEVLEHLPEKCEKCPFKAACKADGNFACTESRYVVDVLVTTKVTEHQTLNPVHCPCDETDLDAHFPDDITAYIQYGDSVTVLAGLLSTYGAISYERLRVILNSLMGVHLSTGTLVAMVSRCSDKIGPVMMDVQDLLKQTDVTHYDETGIRVNGRLHWVHNASSTDYTYQTLNEKRGHEGIEDNGVLAASTGVAVHDCWMPYWKYSNVTHAVCGAHLLRELEGIRENEPEQTWAAEFQLLLLRMKAHKEKCLQNELEKAGEYHLHKFSREYDRIIAEANVQCPPPATTGKKRGRKKKGKERALLERLVLYQEEVCRFLTDFRVPFDNNQAERDLRNCKTKAKVSGCFRSKEGAQDYLNLSSFISTAKKHGISAFEALKNAIRGMGNAILGKLKPQSA